MADISASEFIEKIATDPGFRSQVGISPTMQLDEFRDKAAAAGFNYTPEEILAAAEGQQEGALTDDALENVSGGALRRNAEIEISVTVKF